MWRKSYFIFEKSPCFTTQNAEPLQRFLTISCWLHVLTPTLHVQGPGPGPERQPELICLPGNLTEGLASMHFYHGRAESGAPFHVSGLKHKLPPAPFNVVLGPSIAFIGAVPPHTRRAPCDVLRLVTMRIGHADWWLLALSRLQAQRRGQPCAHWLQEVVGAPAKTGPVLEAARQRLATSHCPATSTSFWTILGPL